MEYLQSCHGREVVIVPKTDLQQRRGTKSVENMIKKQPQLQKEAQYSHKVMMLMEENQRTDALKRNTFTPSDSHSSMDEPSAVG